MMAAVIGTLLTRVGQPEDPRYHHSKYLTSQLIADVMASESDLGLKWHPDIDKVASFGNDHYFALVNNTPWLINISCGTAGDHKNGLKFTTTVESSDCYVHVCSKVGWTFSSGGTFYVRADRKDMTDVQFIDFALSNPVVTGRKIHAIPVDTNEYGAKAWKDLDKTDTMKSFVYQDRLCVVKGEIQPGQNGCCVWKFCIQVSEGMQIKEQPQTWDDDKDSVMLSVDATGLGTLSYQWLKDGGDIDTVEYPNCSGIDTPMLTISPFTSDYEGNYSCLVKDQAGQNIESNPITIKASTDDQDFSNPIEITRQTRAVCSNSNGATITVSASGPGELSYAWKKDGQIITSAACPNCTGFNSDTLTISPFTILYEGNYSCVISNQEGLSIESEVTTVKVAPSRDFSEAENPIGYAAQQLEKKAEEWEENFVVQAVKRMANLMKEMDKYTTEDEFDEEELSDLLSRVIEITKEVVMVANRAAEACPNRLPKRDVLQQVEIINGAVNFLEVLTSINAARLKEGDTDAKEKLTRNATQLLNAVCVIIQAIETATLTLSDEAREQLDLPKWVKLARKASSSISA